ncbi:hypothetical protein ABGB07_42640 [Micromonosporaceae bacterium B7E4]
MCTGWIRVIHDRNYSTDYYHLWSSISVNGAAVGQGAYLGNTGTDVTCGGAATGRHVHFGLRQNSAYVGIAGHSIGKWEFANGAAAYQGGARHGSAWTGVGGGLYNHGARARSVRVSRAPTAGWDRPGSNTDVDGSLQARPDREHWVVEARLPRRLAGASASSAYSWSTTSRWSAPDSV